MKNILLFFSLLLPNLAQAQKVSDPALHPYVELWQNDNVDSLHNALPSLLKKYPKQPEIFFFQSVYETDAEKANTGYAFVLKNFPDNVLADECLYRLIQYDYAKGHYREAREKGGQFKNNYPSSRFIDKIDQMFSGLGQAAVNPSEEKIPAADSSASVKTTVKKFRLQVGAFGQIKNAEDLRDKLKNNGYKPIEFSEKIVNDKKLFLVWVGAFDSKEEAAKTGDVLRNKFQLNPTIVEK